MIYIRYINFIIIIIIISLVIRNVSSSTNTTSIVNIIINQPFGNHIIKLATPTYISNNHEKLKERLFMHPNVIGKGCIDNLVDENEFTKRLHLKDCGLFIRNIEHTYQNRTKNMNNNNNNNNNSRTSSIIESIEFEDNVNKGKDIIKLQTMSLKSTLDRIKQYIQQGQYYVGKFLLKHLLKVQYQIKDIKLRKQIDGYNKLITAQHKHLIETIIDPATMDTPQYITALLQIAWVLHSDGKVGQVIQILYEISDAYHDYKKKDNIQDQDLRELLQLSMEMGEYDIAKSISKTSYRRMANKYKDVAFHVALAMECTGTKDDQLYALEVYDNLLNTCYQSKPGKCVGIISYQSFYARQMWYHREAPLIKGKQISSITKDANFISYLTQNNIYLNVTHIKRRKITKEKFFKYYSNIGKPVILEKIIPKKFFNIFNKENLAKKFGNNTVSVSESQYIVPRQYFEDCRLMLVDCDIANRNDALFFQRRMGLKEYLNILSTQRKQVKIEVKGKKKEDKLDAEQETEKTLTMDEMEYLFGSFYRNRHDDKNNNVESLKELFSQIKNFFPNSKFVNVEADKNEFFHGMPLFYIGNPMSYTYWHDHGAAVNILLSGKKKWYLLPPGSYFGPRVDSMSNYLKNIYKHSPIKPLEVIQYPGDCIFIPATWNHAVINLEEVIGVTFQLGEDMELRKTSRNEMIKSERYLNIRRKM